VPSAPGTVSRSAAGLPPSTVPPLVPAVPVAPAGAPTGTPDALSGAGSAPGAAGFAGLALLIVVVLAMPGLARVRRLVVVPSTAAIVSLHEVPG
jgi:hypothetical protein